MRHVFTLSIALFAFSLLPFNGLGQAPSFEWVIPQGNLFGGQVRFIEEDPQGYIMVGGYFTDEVDFDPGDGTDFLDAAFSRGIFIQKLTPEGELEWVQEIDSSESMDLTGFQVDAEGNVFATGHFRESVVFGRFPNGQSFTSNGDRDGFVVKFSPSGDLLFAHVIGGASVDRFLALCLDTDGNVYVTGYFFETVDFDPGAGTAELTALAADGFILKLDNDGNFQFVKQLETDIFAIGESLAWTANNELVLGGAFAGATDFDPNAGEFVVSSTSGKDSIEGFVAKYQSDGSLVWVDHFTCTGEMHVYDLTTDEDGNIFATGIYSNITDFNPDPLEVEILPTVSFFASGFILRLTSAGEFTWAKGLNATQSLIARAIDLDDANRIFVTGDYNGTADLDPGPGEVASPAGGATEQDFFLLKLETTGDYIWSMHENGEGHAVWAANNIIYSGGGFRGLTDFDPSEEGEAIETTPGASGLSFLLKLNDCPPAAPSPVQAVLATVEAECEIASIPAPEALNACGNSIFATTTTAFPITAQGTTTIVWTYAAGTANAVTQTQDVTIADVTAPVADVAELEAIASECGLTSLTAPTATDNCDGVITATHDAVFPITASGTITWTYQDGSGNASSQTQEVIVADQTAPLPNTQNLPVVTAECQLTSLTAPTATDNCAGSIEGETNASFPITASTTVTWTYDDENGNTSTQTQEVVITAIDNGIFLVDELTLSANASGYTYQWVDCAGGNAPISGATAQTFEVSESGDYAVEVSNGVCTVLSECIEVVVSSVAELQANGWYVFPNPASTFVEIGGDGVLRDVKLVNALGQEISVEYRREERRVFLPRDLAGGTYFLRLYGEVGVAVHRLGVN